MSNKEICSSRRNLIKAAALAGVSGATLPFSSHASESTQFDETYDVVVIGSGYGGLSTALRACELGLSVLVAEKMPTFGGNSCFNGSGFAVAGLSEQAELGIEDSPELFEKDILKSGQGLSSPALARALAFGSKDAFEWVESHGVKFAKGVYRYGGHSVPRVKICTRPIGGSITIPIREKGEELGVKYRSRCSMQQLIIQGGAVIGVEVREHHDWTKPGSGLKKNIRATRAVVVATGGYAADVQFRLLHDPRLHADLPDTQQPGASAQGLKEILRIGGAGKHLSYIQIGPWGSPDEHGYGDSPDYSPFAGFTHGVAIDVNTGKRFIDESGDRNVRARAVYDILAQTPDAHPVLCYDSIGHNDPGIPDTRRRRIIKSGVVKEFATLNELAKHYGIPVKPFLAQIERYNKAVEAGHDKEYGKILDRLKPISKPPFYAQRFGNLIHYTEGGAAINENASVLDLNGKPIPNLYAVGEVSSGAHGASRLGGCGTADGLVMGRIAAEHIANKV